MKPTVKTVKPELIQIAKELEAVQSLMPIERADRGRLKADIQAYGIKDPLRGYEKAGRFHLLSGFTRLQIVRELGIKAVPILVVAVKPTDRQTYSINENLARRQLNSRQKRELIDYLLDKPIQASNRAIARQVGASHHTVEARRKKRGGQSAQAVLPKIDTAPQARQPAKAGNLEAAFRRFLLINCQGMRKELIEHAFKSAMERVNDGK